MTDKAKLILSMDGLVLKEIPLTKERTTIGRKPHNDIRIDNLAVSGEHAAVVTILADSFLEDLGSTNGTLVNGRPVAKHFLRDRDQVDIGRQLIVYLADDGARAEPRLLPDVPEVAAAPASANAAVGAADETFDAEIAAIRQARVDTATALPPEPPEAAPPPVHVRARLRVLTGPSAGRVVPVTGDEFVLGRVGMQVAAIVFRDGDLVLVPREGPQPPTLNGEPVPADGCPVRTGDGLEVAGTRLELLGPE